MFTWNDFKSQRRVRSFEKSILIHVMMSKAWPLTVREERRLRLFENRVFRPMKDENGEWRSLQNAELHSLYGSPNIVRVIV